MVHIPLMFLSEWREFPSAPCLAEKKNLTARVSMLLKSRASPDVLPFSLCNRKRLAIQHMNRPLFPTKLSIPSYDIGKKVGLRTYQLPLVCMYVYMCVCIVVCVCVCVCMYVHTFVYMYVCITYVRTFVCMYVLRFYVCM